MSLAPRCTLENETRPGATLDDPDTTDDALQPYAPSAVLDLPMGLAGGSLTVYVTFVDDAGNEVTVCDSIYYDATAPIPGGLAVQIESGADFASSLSVTLSLDAADASEMQSSTTDLTNAQTTTTAWVPLAALSLALLPSGDYAPGVACKEICVRFRDAAGNETDETDCDVVNLDRTPHAVPVVVSDLSYTQARTISLELSEQPADAQFSHCEILVTPGQDDYTSIATSSEDPPIFDLDLPPIVDVTLPLYVKKQGYLIRLRAVDRAGNVGAEVPLQVVFDENDPATPISSGTGSVVNAATYSFFFDTASEAHQDATFDYYEAGQVSCDGPGTGSCESDALPSSWTETAQTDGLLFPLLQGGDTTCVSPCINKLFVRAVDEFDRIAIDESGTQTAFSQAHKIFVTSTGVGCSWGTPVEVSTTTPTIGGPPGPPRVAEQTKDIAMAIAADGASVIAWEKSIEASFGEMWCSRTPDVGVPLVGETHFSYGWNQGGIHRAYPRCRRR